MSVWDEGNEVGQRYLQVCRDAVADEEVFASFKLHPHYSPILEHLTRKEGNLYNGHGEWSEIPRRVYFNAHVNDSLGRAGENIWELGDFSPSTRRYMWMACRIYDLWKQPSWRRHNVIRHCNIAEIGGGYGGLALLLSNPLTHWSFFDLPDVKALQNKYMTRARAQTTWDFPDVCSQRKYEFVISSYALSEVADDVFWQYMEHVVAKARRGFLICNDRDRHVQKAIERSGLMPTISKDPGSEKNYVVTWDKEKSDQHAISEACRKYKGPARSGIGGPPANYYVFARP